MSRKEKEKEDLTRREKEVLELLAEGMTYQEIAADLVVSVHTVDSHVRSIYRKLGVGNRTKAVIKWLGNKLKK